MSAAQAKLKAQIAVPPVAPAAPSRMTLTSLVRGRIAQPVRVTVYGDDGIGKSTFAASAPKPIFIGAEDGTSQLDVVRFPSPENWTDILDAIRVLTLESHEFETLVIDTLDWAEPFLWQHICKRDSKKDVEAYGYGAGYSAALTEWLVFLKALEQLRKAKPMNLIFLAHSQITTYKNPAGEDYDRHTLKLHAKAAGKIREWCDAVLFATYETLTAKDEKTKRVRGVDTGARLLYTERRAAYDAKNRYGLPEAIPLSWDDFAAGMQARAPVEPSVLRSEIERKAALLGADGAKFLAALSKAGDDANKLAQLNNVVNTKLKNMNSEAHND